MLNNSADPGLFDIRPCSAYNDLLIEVGRTSGFSNSNIASRYSDVGAKFVLMPINYSNHWHLVIYNVEEQRFTFLTRCRLQTILPCSSQLLGHTLIVNKTPR